MKLEAPDQAISRRSSTDWANRCSFLFLYLQIASVLAARLQVQEERPYSNIQAATTTVGCAQIEVLSDSGTEDFTSTPFGCVRFLDQAAIKGKYGESTTSVMIMGTPRRLSIQQSHNSLSSPPCPQAASHATTIAVNQIQATLVPDIERGERWGDPVTVYFNSVGPDEAYHADISAASWIGETYVNAFTFHRSQSTAVSLQLGDIITVHAASGIRANFDHPASSLLTWTGVSLDPYNAPGDVEKQLKEMAKRAKQTYDTAKLFLGAKSFADVLGNFAASQGDLMTAAMSLLTVVRSPPPLLGWVAAVSAASQTASIAIDHTLTRLINDPPDDDYRLISPIMLAKLDLTSLQALPDARRTSLEDGAYSVMELAAVLRTALVTMERMAGAGVAGEEGYRSMQAYILYEHIQWAEVLCVRISSAFRRAADVIRETEGVIAISSSEHESFQTLLAGGSLPGMEEQYLSELGLSQLEWRPTVERLQRLPAQLTIGLEASDIYSAAADLFARLGSAFAVQDGDSDSLGDLEEIYLHGTNPALRDTDGDGSPDGDEIRAGTSTTNAHSLMRVTKIARSEDDSVTITWTSRSGLRYRVDSSLNVQFRTDVVQGRNVVGEEGTTTLSDAVRPGDRGLTRFWRVVLVED